MVFLKGFHEGVSGWYTCMVCNQSLTSVLCGNFKELHFPTAQLHNCQLPWQLWRFVCGITNCCGAILSCLCDFSVRSAATDVVNSSLITKIYTVSATCQ